MNAFDIRVGEPTHLRAGDLWEWSREDLARSYAPEEYDLTYSLVPISGGAAIELVAGANFVISKLDTAAHKGGEYRWTAFIVRKSDSARRTIDSGVFEILADASSGDSRTANETALAAIQAVLAGRAGKDQESYTIEGRSLSRTPIEDLMRLERLYRGRVEDERARDPNSRTESRAAIKSIKVRFD